MGLLYLPHSLTRAIFGMQQYTHGLRQISSASVYCNGIFNFNILWWRHLASVEETKLNASAQLQTFAYPMISKGFSYSNVLMAKSLALTLNVTAKKQKNTERFAPPLLAGAKSQPTILSMAIEEICNILASPKGFHVRRIVSPLGGAKILEETHSNFKSL